MSDERPPGSSEETNQSGQLTRRQFLIASGRAAAAAALPNPPSLPQLETDEPLFPDERYKRQALNAFKEQVIGKERLSEKEIFYKGTADTVIVGFENDPSTSEHRYTEQNPIKYRMGAKASEHDSMEGFYFALDPSDIEVELIKENKQVIGAQYWTKASHLDVVGREGHARVSLGKAEYGVTFKRRWGWPKPIEHWKMVQLNMDVRPKGEVLSISSRATYLRGFVHANSLVATTKLFGKELPWYGLSTISALEMDNPRVFGGDYFLSNALVGDEQRYAGAGALCDLTNNIADAALDTDAVNIKKRHIHQQGAMEDPNDLDIREASIWVDHDQPEHNVDLVVASSNQDQPVYIAANFATGPTTGEGSEGQYPPLYPRFLTHRHYEMYQVVLVSRRPSEEDKEKLMTKFDKLFAAEVPESLKGPVAALDEVRDIGLLINRFLKEEEELTSQQLENIFNMSYRIQTIRSIWENGYFQNYLSSLEPDYYQQLEQFVVSVFALEDNARKLDNYLNNILKDMGQGDLAAGYKAAFTEYDLLREEAKEKISYSVKYLLWVRDRFNDDRLGEVMRDFYRLLRSVNPEHINSEMSLWNAAHEDGSDYNASSVPFRYVFSPSREEAEDVYIFKDIKALIDSAVSRESYSEAFSFEKQEKLPAGKRIELSQDSFAAWDNEDQRGDHIYLYFGTLGTAEEPNIFVRQDSPPIYGKLKGMSKGDKGYIIWPDGKKLGIDYSDPETPVIVANAENVLGLPLRVYRMDPGTYDFGRVENEQVGFWE